MRMGSKPIGWPLAAALAAGAVCGATAPGAAQTVAPQPTRTIHLDKGQPAERCSTGEQKALLIGLILAHADLVADATGRRPLLLLDEVAAHLDPRRRQALFERLAASGGQVLMTGTDRELFAGLGEDAIHRVADGRVDPPAGG